MGDAKSVKGLGKMSLERRREIARAGGLAAQAKGTAHKWTREEAAAAGRKGGLRGGTRKRTGARADKADKE